MSAPAHILGHTPPVDIEEFYTEMAENASQNSVIPLVSPSPDHRKGVGIEGSQEFTMTLDPSTSSGPSPRSGLRSG